MHKILLAVILALFLLTRLYQITAIPASLYWDEASIGYNAYSILKTGRDEWGRFLPVHFRAFGEFKLPIYVYSTAVTESIFDLTVLAIRLPAVLYGLGSLVTVYLISGKITQKRAVGLLSAFYLAISPWFFIFSRAGYEATAGLFFFLLAVYIFLLSQKNRVLLLLSICGLILSMYSYNSFRLLSGLAILAALVYTLWSDRAKQTVLVCLLGLFIFAASAIPVFRLYLLDAGFARTQAFALFPRIQLVPDSSGRPNLQVVSDSATSTGWSRSLTTIAGNYLFHFSPQFLLLWGDKNPRSQQPGFGQLYPIDLLFIFFGLWALLKLRRFYLMLVLFLLAIAPVPASLFKESPHALRSILTPAALAILIALGVAEACKRRLRLLIPVVLVYLLLFGNYYWHFLASYNIRAATDWQYGYYRVYQDYSNRFPGYDRIIVSDHFAQPYVFPLAYLKIDPRDFQNHARRNPVDQWGFSTVSSFGKFEFGKADKLVKTARGRLLVFASIEDKLAGENPDSVIKLLDGSDGLYVYSLRK